MEELSGGRLYCEEWRWSRDTPSQAGSPPSEQMQITAANTQLRTWPNTGLVAGALRK